MALKALQVIMLAGEAEAQALVVLVSELMVWQRLVQVVILLYKVRQ